MVSFLLNTNLRFYDASLLCSYRRIANGKLSKEMDVAFFFLRLSCLKSALRAPTRNVVQDDGRARRSSCSPVAGAYRWVSKASEE